MNEWPGSQCRLVGILGFEWPDCVRETIANSFLGGSEGVSGEIEFGHAAIGKAKERRKRKKSLYHTNSADGAADAEPQIGRKKGNEVYGRIVARHQLSGTVY